MTSSADRPFELDDPGKDGETLVVFVHGLGSKPDHYWGESRKLLLEDRDLRNAGVRMGFWGYPTSKWPQGFILLRLFSRRPRLPRVRDIGRLLWDELSNQEEFGRFNRIALFGHSMGGLVAQAAACYATDAGTRARLVAIGLCATPTAGSQLADLISAMAGYWGGNVQIDDLAVGSTNRLELQAEFLRQVIEDGGQPQVSITPWLALEDPIVTDTAMDTWFYERRKMLRGDHSSCVRGADNVSTFKNWITGTVLGHGQSPMLVTAETKRLYGHLRALGELYARTPPVDYEESVNFEYFISETDLDVVDRTYTIERAGSPVFFHQLGFGCSQDSDVGGIADLDVTLETPEGVSGLVIPTAEKPGRIAAAAFFNPPLAAKQQFGVRHLWKGCWDPLRRTGEDAGNVKLTRRVKRLKISLDFPQGTARDFEVTSTTGPNPRLSYDRDLVRPRALMVYNDVEPGTYAYKVRATLPGL